MKTGRQPEQLQSYESALSEVLQELASVPLELWCSKIHKWLFFLDSAIIVKWWWHLVFVSYRIEMGYCSCDGLKEQRTVLISLQMESHTNIEPWREYLFVFRATCNAILLSLNIQWIEVRAHFYPSISTDSIESKLRGLDIHLHFDFMFSKLLTKLFLRKQNKHLLSRFLSESMIWFGKACKSWLFILCFNRHH